MTADRPDPMEPLGELIRELEEAERISGRFFYRVHEKLPALRAAIEAMKEEQVKITPKLLKIFCESLLWRIENGNTEESLEASRIAEEVAAMLNKAPPRKAV